MAYEIADGFDNYDASHTRWDVINGTPTHSSASARFPAAPNCVSKGVAFTTSQYYVKNLSGNRPGLVISTAVAISSLSFSNFEDFINFRDNGNNQCKISFTSSGGIAVRTGGNVVQGQTSPGLIAAGGDYFIDIVISFASGTGTCTIYLSTPAGGGPVLALTNITTITTANAYANQVQIGELGGISFMTISFDDFHCHTNTGAAPNAPLGEGTRIYTKVPNGAGYATTLTPNGAAANWQCVDDVPPDDDTTYVAAAAFPLTEGYGVGAGGFTGVVNGVVRVSRVRKDDASAHTFQNGVRSSGVNSLSAAANVNSTYAWIDGGWVPLDPNTGIAWTASGADAAQPIISAAS